VTFGLGNRCSIRLSYGTDVEHLYFKIWRFESAGPSKPTSDQVKATLGRNSQELDHARPQIAATPSSVLCASRIVVKFESKDFYITTKIRRPVG
jgi:hypothetical protein